MPTRWDGSLDGRAISRTVSQARAHTHLGSELPRRDVDGVWPTILDARTIEIGESRHHTNEWRVGYRLMLPG